MSTDAAVASHAVRISRKQLLSILGLVPLGVYVFLHLWTNLESLNGELAFNTAVLRSRNHPAFILLEIFGLGLPLLVHTVLGLMEIGRARPNNVVYSTFDNLKFVLQRASAIGLLLFIGAHVYKARIAPDLVVNGHESWQGMHNGLSEPITLTVYVLGMLAVSYHLANGMQTASMRLGVVMTPAGQRRMQWVSGTLFVILLAMSGAAIYGFQPTLGE